MDDLCIQFGALRNVIGRPEMHGDFTFVPAALKLDGNGFSTDFYLRDSVGEMPPPILTVPIKEQYDVAWVRSRIPRIFGFTPELSDVEKSLLDVGFIAVFESANVGIPFRCTDSSGRSCLMFSPEGPDVATQKNIAAAFWSLLLQSPEDLDDFDARVFHPGAGVWMHFSCKNGEPCYGESQE